MRALSLFAAVMLAATAHAQSAPLVRATLGHHFAQSTNVRFVRLRPQGADRTRIERMLGTPLVRTQYVVYVASTGARCDGYAVFDDEIGQHEPIDLVTFFDPAGRVTGVEVLAYREPYGDGIRSARFLAQLAGRDASSSFEVDAVSGATISSRSVARAVRRATIIVGEVVRGAAR